MTGRSSEPPPRNAGTEPWDRIGWHRDHFIEIAISPQLRERDPGRPLSLLEALEVGHPTPAGRQPESEPEREAEL